HVGRDAFAELLDRSRGLLAEFATHARHIVEQHAVELHLLGIHWNGLQPEVRDQLAQRIGAGHRVVVDFGDTRLIRRGRGIEFAGDHLASQAIGSLEAGNASEMVTGKRAPRFFLRYQGLMRPPGPPPTIARSNIVHSAASAAPLPRKARGLIPLSKSAFHPEGKMNKAGSRTAAMKKNKKAGA